MPEGLALFLRGMALVLGGAALVFGSAALVLGGVALLYFLFAPLIATPFSDDPRVRILVVAMLTRLAIFIPFDGLQLCFMSALRSLGDQVAAGINGIISYFLVAGGLGWWLYAAGAGPLGLVWAAGAGMIVATLLQGGRMAWISRRSRSSG